MTHEEVRDLLGAYALDATDASEARAIEHHLAECSSCRGEVDGYRSVASVLAGAGERAPDTAWEGIVEQLDPDAEGSDKEALPANVRRLPRRAPWIALTAIAAAVALVVGAAFILERNTSQDLRSRLVAAESRAVEAESALSSVVGEDALVRASRDAAVRGGSVAVSLGGDDTSATMTIVLTEDGTGYVSESSLPALPDGRTYQLWAVVEGRVISAGVLGQDPEVVPFRVDPSGLEALAITEEIAGGVAVSENPILVAWSR